MGELTRNPSEAAVLAAEIKEAAARIGRFFVDGLDKKSDLHLVEAFLDPVGADAKAKDTILSAPSDSLLWSDLDRVAEFDYELAVGVWKRAQLDARDELDTGHRAARVLEVVGSPWDRAQFLALRESFWEEWRPRGGIENSLIDAMSQAYTQYEFWLKMLAERSHANAVRQTKTIETHCLWEPPLQDEADAVELAGAMAERFHRMYLRTLRAMKDHRRYAGPVVVQSAGQVNVGGQQVNVVSEGP